MGKIYNVFVKLILKIVDYYGVKVRNIIGDWVMVVFLLENCFMKVVYCVIIINYILGEINRVFKNVDFKCGIGIDYGKMCVIKVGIEKKGDENVNYKNLIWVGYFVNKVFRLMDMVNKIIVEDYFEVIRNLINLRVFKLLFEYLFFLGSGLLYDFNVLFYLNMVEKVEMSVE